MPALCLPRSLMLQERGPRGELGGGAAEGTGGDRDNAAAEEQRRRQQGQQEQQEREGEQDLPSVAAVRAALEANRRLQERLKRLLRSTDRAISK